MGSQGREGNDTQERAAGGGEQRLPAASAHGVPTLPTKLNDAPTHADLEETSAVNHDVSSRFIASNN